MPTTITTNANYHLQINNEKYPIYKIIGEEAISTPFHFEIYLILPLDTSINHFQYSTAILITLLSDSSQKSRAGIITSITHYGLFDNENINIKLTLEPRLSLLRPAKSQRLFLNQSVIEIIQSLLLNIGYINTQIKISCNNNFPTRPYTLQAPDETDLAFLQRLLAYSGVFYWIDCSDEQEFFYLSDNNQSFHYLCMEKILYIPPSCLDPTETTTNNLGFIFNLKVQAQLITQKHTVQNFNADDDYFIAQATHQLSTSQNLILHQHHFAANVYDYDTALNQATLRANFETVKALQLTAKSNIKLLNVGNIISLNTWHFCETNEFDDDYIIISVKHFLDPNTSIYHNKITLIPISTNYCDPIPDMPKLPVPWVSRIESLHNFPYLDNQGKYRLRHHFDLSGQPNTEASPWIYRLSNHGGIPQNAHVGIHLPIRASTDVLISCLNSDIDSPVILGALPNALNKSPVTSQNSSQNILQTQSNNQMLFDDTPDNEKIQIANHNSQNLIELSNASSESKSQLVSNHGSIYLTANKSISLDAESDLAERCSTRSYKSTANFFTKTINNNIAYKSLNFQSFIAKQNIYMHSGKDIVIDTGDNLLINSGESAIINVNQGDCDINVQSEKMIIKTNGSINMIGNGKASLQFCYSGGSITITKNGDILVNGNIINLETISGVYLNGSVMGAT